jgi:hypothetical protein
MNLARPFKAGNGPTRRSRRVATRETGFNRRYATRTNTNLVLALKRQAKFMPTLRVEGTVVAPRQTKVYRTL